jgi:hypothetical protein
MRQVNLTKKELKEFVGGYCVLEEESRDINNTNTKTFCSCDYNNKGAISNTNSADNCRCNCI